MLDIIDIIDIITRWLVMVGWYLLILGIVWVEQCHKPPMTENGKFIPHIFMVMTGGWFMALFYPQNLIFQWFWTSCSHEIQEKCKGFGKSVHKNRNMKFVNILGSFSREKGAYTLYAPETCVGHLRLIGLQLAWKWLDSFSIPVRFKTRVWWLNR